MAMKPDPKCRECGPQGGHGYVDLARFRYPCSYCWGLHIARWRAHYEAETTMHGGFGTWQVTLRRPRYDVFGTDYLGMITQVLPRVACMWELDPHDYSHVVVRFEMDA